MTHKKVTGPALPPRDDYGARPCRPHRSGAQCQIYGELDTPGGFIWSSQHRLREHVQDRFAGEIEHPVAGAFSQGSCTTLQITQIDTGVHLLPNQRGTYLKRQLQSFSMIASGQYTRKLRDVA